MSRPMISALVAGMVTAAGAPAVPVSAVAAELLPPAAPHVRYHHAAPCCGPCGCLHVSYVYHRELRSTYGPASIRAISIRPSRTIISDGYKPTRDTGSVPHLCSDRAAKRGGWVHLT